MDIDDDVAPPPDDVIVVTRALTGHGWSISFDGRQQACFSSAADLASWIRTALTPLDIEAGVVPRPELKTHDGDPLPSILHSDPAKLITPKPARAWRIFNGGRK